MYSAEVLSVANMLPDARRAVQPTKIADCFKHAGFCATQDSVRSGPVLDHFTAKDIAVGKSLVADLRDNGMDIPSTITFGDFCQS